MSESVTWQKKTLLSGSTALKDLASLVGTIQQAASATGAVVSAGMNAAKAFVNTSVNPRLLATVAICDEIIAQIEAIEQAGFYFAYADPYMPGVGQFNRSAGHQTLTAQRVASILADACLDPGDENRPQFDVAAEAGALLIVIAMGSVDPFATALKTYGKLFNVTDWEDLAEDIKQIWTPYDPKTIAVSSRPPDFKAVRFAEMVPLIGRGLSAIKGIAQGFKNAAEASSKSIDRLIAFGEKKTGILTKGIEAFNNDLDTALAIAGATGVYTLLVPNAVGGTKRVTDLISGSIDQLPLELNYSAGCILVAGGPSFGVIEEVLL